jgi:diguanylate cyclase (GGDEF)-like protein
LELTYGNCAKRMTDQPNRTLRPRGLEGHVGRGDQSAEGGLRTYALLSRLHFPKSYQGKILLVVFLGTHVPLVALVLYLVLSSPVGMRPALNILVLLLVATLAGTAAALWALHGLLAPVRLVSSSLREYLGSKRVTDLPVSYADEAGRLMADVQYAVEYLDSTIRSLEGLSGTDHLTGLYNRREAEKRLAEDVARAKRWGGVLTVCVVDVNQFKEVNDTYGHQAGDVCIRHVASVIRRNIRESDWLARWGGDEFVLALRDASPFASTELVLQRIVRDLKDSPVKLPQGDELVLTVTVGASRYMGEEDLQGLLTKADEAMYAAKREGRPWLLSL